MKSFWRKLARIAISTAATGAAVTTTSGDAITSSNVLIPSLIAGAVAALHAVLPPKPTDDAPQEPTIPFKTPPR